MSTDNKNYINLISDIEVYQKDNDYLEFDKYADILLNIIKGTNGPFTLGVKGEWGNGKTSLLRLVEAKINDENKDENKDKTEKEIQTVWFNAWQYEREEHILFPFLATIADSISKSKSKKLEIFGEKLIKIAKSIPSALSFDFGPVSFNTEKAIENYTDPQNKKRYKNFTIYKEAFENLELDEKTKIIVFIDDLDRCSPDNAFKILEAIKLLLNKKGMLFILAISEENLESYLKKIYRDKYGIPEENIKNNKYLDKIINLPFLIPPHKKRLDEFIEKIIENNSSLKEIKDLEKNSENFNEIIDIIKKVTLANPRKIKRILNRMILDFHLLKKDKQEYLFYIFIWRIFEMFNTEAYKYITSENNTEKEKSNLQKIKDLFFESTNITKEQKKKNIEEIFNFSNIFSIVFKDAKIGQEWLKNDEERENSYNFYFEELTASEYISRGNKHATQGQYQEAIKDFDRAIELDSQNSSAYNNRGIAKGELEKYEEAIKDFDRAIELDSQNSSAYNNRGNAKGKLEKYEEAIEEYNRAIELNPQNFSAYYNRGIAKSALKKYKEAIEDYNRAIELNPQNFSAYYNRGIAKSALKKYKEAIEDYDRAIELDSQNSSAYNNRGNAKGKLEKYEEAIEDYDRVIELDPQNSSAYYNRGVAKGELEKYEEAIKDFDEVIKLDPQNSSAYYNRGVAKNALEKYEEAIEDYYRAIELDPQNPSFYANLAEVLFLQDNKQKAKEEMQKALKIVRKSGDEHSILANEFVEYILSGDDENEWQRAKKVVEEKMSEGIKFSNFDFNKLIEKVKKGGHPDKENILEIAKNIVK